MLLCSEMDVRGPIIVIDLEWVGDTTLLSQTHVTQLACRNIASDDVYSCSIMALAATVHPPDLAGSPTAAYTGWLAWMEKQKGEEDTACLVAHNGIRYDAPVLLHNMRRHGVQVPGWITMMDSLHHIRYQTRYWKHGKPSKYDIDSMCAYCGIEVLQVSRHDARYDVDLLCTILQHMHRTYQIPLVSGPSQRLNTLSTMLIRGVGPAIWQSLPTTSLLELCEQIIGAHGNLGEASCTKHLEQDGLKLRMPLCNVDMIASNVATAARVHLQYLEHTGNA